MEGREAATGNPDPLLSSLVYSVEDSVLKCLSGDADKRCASFGLCSLSVLCTLLSRFLLVYQSCTSRREARGETLTSVYGFLGHLCSTVGAVLSSQLYILIIMGAFAAAVDVVHVISHCLPVLLCWESHPVRRQRVMRRRRRQHLLSLCVLMVIGGGFLKSRITHHSSEMPLSGRKLLHVNLQDTTEVLGYILGLLSFVISSTSRFPVLSKAYRGQMFTRPYIFSGLLCTLAGALYVSAILLYDTQFTFVFRVLPWLLSALCCVFLDLLIIFLIWCSRGTRPQLNSFSLDTESLLECLGPQTEDNAVLNTERKQRVNSSANTKSCLKEGTLSQEEREDQPLQETVRVIRVNSFSSDTSYDSSLESSDLEWDFEEANAQWNKQTPKQQEDLEYPLQGWPTHTKPCKFCSCVMSGPLQKTLSVKDDNK